MSTTRFEFLTPVGRLVSGSFFEPQKSDHQNKPKPESEWNYFVALAFPKTAANWFEEQGELGAVFTALRQGAAAQYQGQENQIVDFKWKIDNGDDLKHADKTGYAGHWILKFNRQASIGPCPLYDNNNPPQAVVDPQQAKRGHYYRIAGSSSANGATGAQAGVYVNMNMAQWCAHGEEIVSGPSAAQVFGQAAGGLPMGASTTPMAPAAGMPSPGLPATPATPAAPAAPAATPAPAAPGAVPAPNFAQGGGYAAEPEKYSFGGGAWTKEQLLAGGHTEEMIATYPKV